MLWTRQTILVPQHTYSECIVGVHILLNCAMTALTLKVAYSQKVQDSFFIARIVRKNIPKNYLKLLHPLQGIDNMSILKKFTFTCLIYLQV